MESLRPAASYSNLSFKFVPDTFSSVDIPDSNRMTQTYGCRAGADILLANNLFALADVLSSSPETTQLNILVTAALVFPDVILT